MEKKNAYVKGEKTLEREGRVSIYILETLEHVKLLVLLLYDKGQYTKFTHETWIYFISYCQTCCLADFS